MAATTSATHQQAVDDLESAMTVLDTALDQLLRVDNPLPAVGVAVRLEPTALVIAQLELRRKGPAVQLFSIHIDKAYRRRGYCRAILNRVEERITATDGRVNTFVVGPLMDPGEPLEFYLEDVLKKRPEYKPTPPFSMYRRFDSPALVESSSSSSIMS